MKEIPGFPMYYADENGFIWTTKKKGGDDRTPGKTGRPKRLSVHKNKRGYHFVNLDICGKTFPRAVHRLVLETFIGPRPYGCEACHYPDHSKDNNKLSNLRWDSHLENVRDKRRNLSCPEEKTCRTCGVTFPLSNFYKDRRASDGVHGQCKQCHIATVRKTRDKDKKRLANREYMRRVRLNKLKAK